MLTTEAEPLTAEWDDAVLAAQPGAHFMQSSSWARTRDGHGWRSRRDVIAPDELVVQSFARPVPMLGVLHHLPRLTGVRARHVPALTELARSRGPRSLAVKVEFASPPDPELAEALESAGWMRTLASQYRFSVVIETVGDDEAMLAALKKRARYEVRLAERSGVEVRRVPFTEANILTMLGLIGATAARSRAFFRSHDYLRHVWRIFDEDGRARLYFASHDGAVLAGAVVLTFGASAWYKDGGSLRTSPEVIAPRYLHWRVAQDLRDDGIARYELGNIPPPAGAEQSSQRGLFVFKTGFSHETVEYQPAYELPIGARHPVWHRSEAEFLEGYQRITRDYWY